STVSTTEKAKKRVKRDDVARELPGNGMTEAQRKAAAAVETKKEEEKKEGEKKSTAEVKTEVKADEKKEVKKEEAVTTQAPVHHEEKKVEQKSEHTEAKDGKVEVKTVEKKNGEQKSASEVKTEAKAEEKKKPKHPSGEKEEEEIVVKKEKSVETATRASKEPKKESKEYLGAENHIPVAPDADHHDEKAAESKVDSAHFSLPSEDKHHTVKKDLKVHMQEPVKIEDEKKELPPKLSAVHEKFVLEHSDAFLREIRCLEVTSDDYFGRDLSPYAQHLKGLVFAGPVLVVIAIYLLCTVLRVRLSDETPAQFTDTLGCAFHAGMWFVVALSMFFISNHWAANWSTISNNTFMPVFPIQWSALTLLALIMMVAVAVEGWFNRRLYDDVVCERSYRCYEVIDTSDPAQNEGHFSRLSSPRIF
ncbi:hypothetical protein PRIPAC_85204, partial [Pristionchus pacificus]